MLIPNDKLTPVFKLIKGDALNDQARVLVYSTNECDSIAATLIFASLLQQEFIRYTLRQVDSYENLLTATHEDLKENSDPDLRVTMVLINCGGPIDIVGFLGLPSSVTVIVCDSHLPQHSACIDDQEQVLIFDSENDFTSAPTDDDMMSSEDERPHKRNVGSYFGKSAAKMMYELSCQLDSFSLDVMWWAIVGVTDQYLHGHINEEAYEHEINNFRQQMRDKEQKLVNNVDRGFDDKITFAYEFKFLLYRHWNLYESMYYSKYIASRLGVWKENGKKKLKTMLVRMGLPLEECTNRWNSMNMESKKTVRTKMQEVATQFGLDEIVYKSFYKNIGYKLQVSAADVVLGVTALIESGAENAFWQAYDALSNNPEILQTGIDRAISIQKTIIDYGTSLIDKQIIVKTGPFRYAYINTSNECPLFAHPRALIRLSEFVKETLAELGKAKTKPLCLCAYNETSSSPLVVGVMGVAPSADKKNKFGLAMEQAAVKTNSRVMKHNFNAAVVEVLRDDAKKFMEYLHSGLVV